MSGQKEGEKGKAVPLVEEDPYDVLGVPRGAGDAEVRRAYFSLSLSHHPDRGGDAEAFHRIKRAHDALSDAGKRNTHDAKAMADEAKGRAAVVAECDIDDMEWDEDGGYYSYPCRCGDSFVASEEELKDGVIVMCCSCSFGLRVHDPDTAEQT